MSGSPAPVLKTRQIHCFQVEREKSPGPEMRILLTVRESYVSACRTFPSIRLMTTRQLTDGSAVSGACAACRSGSDASWSSTLPLGLLAICLPLVV
jgi:hypothetical protein